MHIHKNKSQFSESQTLPLKGPTSITQSVAWRSCFTFASKQFPRVCDIFRRFKDIKSRRAHEVLAEVSRNVHAKISKGISNQENVPILIKFSIVSRHLFLYFSTIKIFVCENCSSSCARLAWTNVFLQTVH